VKRLAAPVAAVSRLMRELFLLPLLAYQRLISPALPPRCRYYPSCSSYAIQAVRELGVIRGTVVGAWRVVRCNPWSDGGVDELSDRSLFRGSSGHEHEHGAAA
jgi:putative membrane protein insertion efficiency factor